MKDQRSVGVVEVDIENSLLKYAKPIGAIGALAPCTNPKATPFADVLSSIKARNISKQKGPTYLQVGLLSRSRSKASS